MLGSLKVAQLVSVVFYLIGAILLTVSVSELDDYNKKEEKDEKKTNKKNKKKVK